MGVATKMNKWQAQYAFWSSFGIPAYEENAVPDRKDLTYPYLTYQAVGAPFDSDTFVNVSVWTRSTSLATVTEITDNILKRFENGKAEVRYNGGGFFITPESNFAQVMGDESDTLIKRIILSVVIHW